MGMALNRALGTEGICDNPRAILCKIGCGYELCMVTFKFRIGQLHD